MTAFLGADDSYLGQNIRLLTDVHGNPIAVRAQAVGSAYDYVVRSVSDLPAPGAGFHDLTTGSWAIAAPLALGGNGLRVGAGQTVLIAGLGWDKEITAIGNVLNVTGSGVAVLRDVALTSTGANFAVTVSNSAACCALWNCLLMGQGCLGISACQRVEGWGGLWNASQSTVYIDATTASRLLLVGVRAAAGVPANSFIQYVAGTVVSAIVDSCQVTSCGTGITWAAANLPSQGLLVHGTQLGFAVAAFAGHTQASPLANYKCNGIPAGLLSETPIVP